MSELKNKILNKIKEGKLKMKPSFYFILKFIGIIMGIVILSLIALFLVSFVIFSLRFYGALYLLHFGMRGIKLFIVALPRVLILIILIILFILELFMKNLAPIYRKPLLYSLLVLFIIMLIGGIILERTNFHYHLFRKTPWYSKILLPTLGINVWRGVIENISFNKIIIKDFLGKQYTVYINPFTKIFTRANLKIGDSVVIIGHRINDIIQAEEIRVFNNYFYFK